MLATAQTTAAWILALKKLNIEGPPSVVGTINDGTLRLCSYSENSSDLHDLMHALTNPVIVSLEASSFQNFILESSRTNGIHPKLGSLISLGTVPRVVNQSINAKWTLEIVPGLLHIHHPTSIKASKIRTLIRYFEKILQKLTAEAESRFPALPSQLNLLTEMEKNPSSYVKQLVFKINGSCNLRAMNEGIQSVMQAHDLLRSRFETTANGISLVLQQFLISPVQTSTLAMETFLAADIKRGFTLQDQTFFRVTIVGIQENSSHLVLTIHHLLYDGWCLDTLLQGIFSAYHGGKVEPSTSFFDLVEFVSSNNPEDTRNFWADYLVDCGDDQGLTGKWSGSDQPSREVSKTSTVRHKDLTDLASKLNISSSTLVKAAWALILRQYSNKEQVVFGSVISGRHFPVKGIEGIVGMLVNTIPSKVTFDHQNIKSFLLDIQSNTLDELSYSQTSLVDIKKLTGLNADQNVFSTCLVYQNFQSQEEKQESKSQESKPLFEKVEYDTESAFESFEFDLHIIPAEFLELTLHYDTSVSDEKFADKLLQGYSTKLESLVNALTNGSIEITSSYEELLSIDEDQTNLLMNLGRGPVVELQYECAHHAFEMCVKMDPEAVAIEHDGRQITYGELDQRSTEIARILLSRGVQEGQFVGLLTIRSIEMICGIFGVLKAGAAYVPVDATMPLERINNILRIVDAQLLLVHPEVPEEIVSNIGQGRMISLDAAISNDIPPFARPDLKSSLPAYVVFTSGSTGEPKGVVVTHKSLVNFTTTDNTLHDVQKYEKVSQLVSISFDMCVGDIFCTLSKLGTLVLRSEDDFFSAVRKSTVIHVTPTALSKMKPEEYPHLRRVCIGGEPCSKPLVDKWCQKVELVNAYGPSEVTITSSYHRLESKDAISVGRPMQNTVQYIVDKHLRLLPVGVPGEMVIGGFGVALGYLNRPDLTAERFIPDHFANNDTCMYRTGDICRWTDDGLIQIVGRMDDMVKVKGYRIELEEVAAAVSRHPHVKEACVVVKDDRLIAFVTPASPDIASIREFVSNILPHYMTPTSYLCLEEFPTNTNGKVLKAIDITTEFEPPSSKREKELALIWSSVLGVELDSIHRETSFFELGGDSISAIQLGAKCLEIGLRVLTKDVFKHSTLASMAKLEHSASKADDVLPELQIPDEIVDEIMAKWLKGSTDRAEYDFYPTTPLQANMVAKTVEIQGSYTMQLKFQVSQVVKLDDVPPAILSVMKAHSILRTRFVPTSAGVYQILQNNATEAPIYIYNDLARCCQDDLECGFSPKDDFWFRIGVVVDEQDYVQNVVLTIHHVLYDGWCIDRLVSDLQAALSGLPLEPSPPFKTVVQYLAAQDADRAQTFWTNYLSNWNGPQEIGKIDQTSISESSEISFKVEVPMERIQEVAAGIQVTVTALAKAAWALSLKAYLQTDDIVFGNVVSGRDMGFSTAASIVGMLISTIPCRVRFDKKQGLAEWVRQIHQDQAETNDFCHAGWNEIRKWSGHGGSGRFMNASFVMENLASTISEDERAGEVLFHPILDQKDSQALNFNDFDLQIVIFPQTDHLTFNLQHSASVKHSTATSIGKYFKYATEQLVVLLSSGASEVTVGSLQSVPEQERRKLLSFGEGPKTETPFSLSHHPFERCAEEDPDLVAIEHENRTITYGELNKRATEIARLLIGRGVKTGDYVAIVAVRSIEFIAGIFGVLKAGAAYVPVDVSLPRERVEYIMETTACRLILFQSVVNMDLLKNFPRETLLSLEESLPVAAKTFVPPHVPMTSPSYVVFTSGSTGKPKGVVISHKSHCNFIYGSKSYFGLSKGTPVGNFASIGFDVSVAELFCSLSFFGKLVLRTDDFLASVKRAAVLLITPSGLQKLKPSDVPQLKTVILAAEPVPSKLIQQWKNYVCLCNAYGPTETTQGSSIGYVDENDVVNVGKPLQNTVQYIVDSSLNLVPVGVPGELVIGGMGVSLGYLNRPDLTGEKFVPNHFTNDGTKMYRTGDICQWTEDGKIQVLGRMDDMVKVKGYRVELLEVAAAVARHQDVKEAYVMVQNDAIIAYVTPSNVDSMMVRDFVADILPHYMAPSAYVLLDELPLTINGKALPTMSRATESEGPTTGMEILLARCWASVLDVDISCIRRETSFFELGGDSISAVQLVNVSKSVNPILSVKMVYKYPTLHLMALAWNGNFTDLEEIRNATQKALQGANLVVREDDDILVIRGSKKVDLSSRAMKIVCLHGGQTSASIFAKSMAEMMKLFGTECEFIFLQGDVEYVDEGKPCKLTKEFSKFHDGPFFLWFDPFSKESIERSVSRVAKTLQAIGPVDVLLGFCQGGSMIEKLDRKCFNGHLKKTWDLSVQVSGPNITLDPHQEPLPYPSIHISGILDRHTLTDWMLTQYDEKLRSQYEHPLAHDFPRSNDSIQKMSKMILDTVEKLKAQDQVHKDTVVQHDFIEKDVKTKELHVKAKKKSFFSSLFPCF